ncbi:MAG: Rieske 2Fe-2S domain-containing protein, partial [Nitrososphaeraceae archaeon]
MQDDRYIKIANKKDLNEGGLLKVEHNGKQIVLSMINGKIYAMDSVCSHEGGPLEEGTLDGYEIECPWHGSRFDVTTGEVTNPPADTPQSIYEVKMEANDILISKTATQGENEVIPEVSVGRGTSAFELRLLEKKEVEGTDMMSFKFSKKNEQEGADNNNNKSLDYTAGQYAYFDIGGVSNDPKGPVRHFTIASSPTEDFV